MERMKHNLRVKRNRYIRDYLRDLKFENYKLNKSIEGIPEKMCDNSEFYTGIKKYADKIKEIVDKIQELLPTSEEYAEFRGNINSDINIFEYK